MSDEYYALLMLSEKIHSSKDVHTGLKVKCWFIFIHVAF